MQLTTDLDADLLDRLSNSDHDINETVRRAIRLYDTLENPDEVLADHGLVEVDDAE